jgi:2-methylcitrate dehydratase PrpD
MSDSIAENIARWAATTKSADLPDSVRDAARRSFIDVVGLCLAARDTDYVKAAMNAWGVMAATVGGYLGCWTAD